MVLINEIGDYSDIEAALRGTRKEAPAWKVRPKWRNRVISACTIERTHWLVIEQLINRADDETVRNTLARVCLEEESHRTMFSSLLSLAGAPWQRLVGSELAFIAFTSVLAQTEPEKGARSVFEYLILDHLTHVKALVEETKRLGLESDMVSEVAKLPPGREFSAQFWPTKELIREPYGADADPATKVNVRLVIMAESIGRELIESLGVMGAPESLAHLARRISAVEAEHHLMLRTLLNPNETALEQAFYSELAEVMGLNRLMATEKESGAREAYEFVVEEDEDHLRYLGVLLAERQGADPIALSQSQALSAKPRRTLENYLPELLKTSLSLGPSGRPAAKVA